MKRVQLDGALNILWLSGNSRLTEAAPLAGRPSQVPRGPSHTPRPDPQPPSGVTCVHRHPCLLPCLLNPHLSPVAPVAHLPPLGPHLTWPLGATAQCGHTLSAQRSSFLASLWPAPLPPCRLPGPFCPQARTPGPSSPDVGARGWGSCTTKP